ncbi:hypothetical protein [Gelidibacter japonicus]|uniref:hypothetical protein n=1 Tax=Gelidibacter japonicus TaxID=1962232 RepID=UPI0013D14399|nr:hypothetical protein [Gelidibacter japonicus]
MVLKRHIRSYVILHNIEGQNKKRSLKAKNEQRLRNFQKADALGKFLAVVASQPKIS